MENINKKKQEEQEQEVSSNSTKNTIITLGGSVGVGACGAMVTEQVASMELDLLKTTNELGKPTGHGNMFENVIVRENPGSYKVNNPGTGPNPLFREKNGVDIRLADGTDIQAKCCYSPKRAVESLMKDGKFRYDGQAIYVPKGQKEEVSRLLKESGVDAYVRESNYTYDEIRQLCNPGWKSIKFDATDPKVMGTAVLLGAIVGGCVYLYLHVNKPEKRWWEKALYATGWSAMAFLAVEMIVVGYGQYKRM